MQWEEREPECGKLRGRKQKQVHADRFACQQAPAPALDSISPDAPSPDGSDGRWNSLYRLKLRDGARCNPASQGSAPRPASRILLGTELPCYLAWVRELEGTCPQSYARRSAVGIGCRAGMSRESPALSSTSPAPSPPSPRIFPRACAAAPQSLAASAAS